MAIRNKEVLSERVPSRPSPIAYVTENGFSIFRRSEIETCGLPGTAERSSRPSISAGLPYPLGCSSVTDTAPECRFLVRNPRGSEREVSVGFDDGVVALVQSRRRDDLSLSSTFWLICAERCLATYLWEKNDYPHGGQLTISALSIDELLLATHWSDKQGDY
jgi:hypothetical protein